MVLAIPKALPGAEERDNMISLPALEVGGLKGKSKRQTE